jgi:predicted polyphosphate/ATP-dependent NAD kinase
MSDIAAPARLRIGLIVNPLAGIGGAVALKGSDGEVTVKAARERGAQAHAGERALRALRVLAPFVDRIRLYAGAGDMGEDAVRAAGLECTVPVPRAPGESSAADTVAAALAMAALPVDLLLFAGGDGTARDLCGAIGMRVPVLGIPAGVKMHSGVYAVSPEAAGEALRDLLRGGLLGASAAEVRDLDEDAFRAGRVVAKYHGEMLVPADTRWVQRSKIGETAQEAQLQQDIAAGVLEEVEPGELLILGPGSTTMAIKEQLGIDGTLLGVDVVRDGQCLARDADRQRLLELLAAHAGPARIVVTAIGGQGHVFGRGNQQIGAAVIRAVGVERIVIVATKHKIAELGGRPLLADTDDPALDRELRRYLRVVTGYRESILYPLGEASG